MPDTGPVFAFIAYEVNQVRGVATVTLNRPRYRNALSRRLSEEVETAFHLASQDADVRVIVLAAAGKSFSSGHDLGTPDELADREDRPVGSTVRGRFDHATEVDVERLLRLRATPKPTIAAVQGDCIFAGWMLASAMDVIIATDDARFLATHFQYLSVPWDIGVRNAKGLLFENRFITAQEAHALGLVYRLVPAARLDEEVRSYTDRVASIDPFRARMMKRALNHVEDMQGFPAHVQAAHAFMTVAIADPEFRPRADGIVAQAGEA